MRTSSLLPFVLILCCGFARAAERPNILLIYTDDQSLKTVGCYPRAFPGVRTPNIDHLAKSGVQFAGGYLGAWCMPSRATLLTGRLPHGIESMRMEGKYPGSTYDPQKTPFWPSVFRQHGYHTAQIGKWHTGTDAGYGRDWDYQVVWNRPKHPENAGNYYNKQLLSTNGGEPEKVDGYSTDHYTKLALEYIAGKHRDMSKPWYLWLCYGGVHGPAHPGPRHVGAYKDLAVPTPADIFGPRPGKPAYLDLTQAWSRGANGQPVMGKSGEKFGDDSDANPRTFANWVRQVNECVLSLDEGVGRLMTALRESNQLENTLVVFTSDQGFAMGEHGFRTKVAPYDANYLSPLIISRYGTIPYDKVSPHAVGGPDLVVTFFKHAGLELPWEMHGRDITPLLQDPTSTAWTHPVLYEHTGDVFGSDVSRTLKSGGKAVHDHVPWYFAIRHGGLKYIRTANPADPEEYYDLEADPEELTNLAGHAIYRPTLMRLRETLRQELVRTGADFVDSLPKP